MPKPIPRPSILDGFEYLGAVNGQRRWRSHGGQRLYEWDGTHGGVEVHNCRGQHLVQSRRETLRQGVVNDCEEPLRSAMRASGRIAPSPAL
jgi:hypothetical protein